ncbi:hypothetical protein SJX93_12135 [Streptomyces cyaneofuscatus]|uniref:hypothetical protein n=1 Tax=Streptomyces cyaneofuscatus TaxID=66883 RepID=UPI002D7A11A8|nr:hypothetical protein [Streptomyces cyaneofuscatus]WRO10316.1 hypothetical protein SJX93_12135 [Streptomyces cyaneofuscatus]
MRWTASGTNSGGQLFHHPGPHTLTAQRQLVHNGAAVCWIAKDTVLIPYGGHPGTYPAHDGEDWSGEMASWA